VALQHLGDARRALGDIDGALDALEAAHRADPDDPAIANNLAWALLEHPARWPEAERLVRTALTRDPPRRAYYLDTLGMLLLRQARPGDALDAFRQALADPELSDPRAREAVGRHAADALRWLEAAGAGESCTDGGSPPASRGGKGGESKDDLGLFEIVC
jgi:tetratricopeptide (TPR) repeat protein